MKIKLNRIISIIILSIMVINIIPIKVYAADASLTSGKKEINVGETTSITASIASVEAWTLKITSSGGNLSGTTESTDASDGETSKAVINANFSANSAGTYTITLTGEITGSDLKKKSVSKTLKITVKEEKPQEQPKPENNAPTPNQNTNKNEIPQDAPTQKPQEQTKSRNYYLSSLSVSTETGEISLVQTNDENAGFNRGVENYTVKFPEDFKFEEFNVMKISATAEDSKAKVSGTGEQIINEGDNNFEIRCTAENGSVKTYKIKVTKEVIIKESELKIDLLNLTAINEDGEQQKLELDKNFSKDILSYKCNVKSDIKSIGIKIDVPKVKDKEIIVKINEEEVTRDLDEKLEEKIIDIEDGENTIKISLISPLDGNVQTDYVITVNREQIIETVAEVSNQKFFSKENLPKIIIGSICGIILLLVIVLIILLIINKKQKNKNKETTEEEKELFNFDEEDTYLNDNMLDKLNKEYEDKVAVNEYKEKIKVDEEKEVAENEEEKKDTDKNEENEKNIDDMELNKYENLSEEQRKNKIDELLKDIKNKGKK